MEDRMYDDNQKLWKKNQDLRKDLEKMNKQFRYLQYDHNNKCIEISVLGDKIESYKSVKSKYFYTRIHLVFCYMMMMMMFTEFVLEFPVFELIRIYGKDMMSFLWKGFQDYFLVF